MADPLTRPGRRSPPRLMCIYGGGKLTGGATASYNLCLPICSSHFVQNTGVHSSALVGSVRARETASKRQKTTCSCPCPAAAPHAASLPLRAFAKISCLSTFLRAWPPVRSGFTGVPPAFGFRNPSPTPGSGGSSRSTLPARLNAEDAIRIHVQCDNKQGLGGEGTGERHALRVSGRAHAKEHPLARRQELQLRTTYEDR